MGNETTPTPQASNTAPTPQTPAASQSPQDLMVNAITEAFKEDANLTQRLIASVKKPTTVNLAIEDFFGDAQRKKSLSVPLYNKVMLAKTLGKWTQNNPVLMPFLLRSAVAPGMNLSEVASKFYTLPADAGSAKADAVTAFQTALFTQEAAAAILGLVDRNEILIDDNNLKPGILNMLRATVKSGSNISRVRAATLLETSEVESSADLQPKLIDLFEDIQRLQNLVRLPQHISALLQEKYKSAHSIAVVNVTVFTTRMVIDGLEEADARRIHDHATNIEIRNEQAWAIALRERNEQLVLPTPLANPPAQSASTPAVTGSAVNLSTLFKDMDIIECADCSSITSPSAYLVDLLRFLQQSRKLSSAGSPTLFSNLMKRRPDLQHLQLSCANTNKTIPYIDLVNEQLEYFVLNINGKASDIADAFAKYNSASPDGTDVSSQQPQNINPSIYQDYVQKEVFPISQLPYSYNVDTSRVILEALGTSREAVLKVFRADEARLTNLSPLFGTEFTGIDMERIATQNRLATTRAIAAESLGLLPEDFWAITGDGFEPRAFMQAYVGVNDAYFTYDWILGGRQGMDISVPALWGYRKDGDIQASDLMLDDKKGTGLTFIKRQLLPRGEISMAELLEILGTQFLAQRLMIVAETPDGTFKDDLDVMRLKATALVDPGSDRLTEDLCRDLQAFIRLRKKTGISVSELDSIITCSLRSTSTDSLSLNPAAIEDLAAIKQISAITHMSLSELQPLWGDMDVNGPKSLYARLFYRPRIVAQDPIFTNLNSKELPSNRAISEHRTVIMAALGIVEKDLDILLEAAGLKATDNLTVNSISLIYRVHVLYTIFGVKNTEYSQLLASMSATAEMICQTPQKTLQYLQQWQSIMATGLTMDDLTQIIPNKSYSPPREALLDFSARINAGMATIDRAYPLPKEDASTFEDVQKMVSLVFDTMVVPSIMNLIEGTYTVSCTVTSVPKNPATDLASKQLSKLKWEASSQPDEGRLTLSGLLTATEKTTATGLISGTNWSSAIDFLTVESRKIFDQLKTRLQLKELDAEAKLAGPNPDEEVVKSRRSFILSACIPILRAQLARQVVLDLVSTEFNIVDPASLLVILTDAIKILGPDQVTNVTALDTLRTLCDLQPNKIQFTGFFIPPTTNSFIFVSSNKTSELSLDGAPLKPDELTNERRFKTLRLLNSKPYKIWYKGDFLKEVRFMPKDGLIPVKVSAESHLDGRIVDAVTSLYRGLVSSSRLTHTLKLAPEEIQYFHRGKDKPLTCDFNNVTYRNLQDLVPYYNLRQALNSASLENKSSLLSLFTFCEDDVKDVKTDLRTSALLYSKIADVSGWPETVIKQFIVQKYPSKSLNYLLALFRGVRELSSMQEGITLSQSLTSVLPSLELSTLFGLAMRRSYIRSLPLWYESTSAEKLRLATISSLQKNEALASAIDNLRQHRRSALLAYLLQQASVKKLGMVNEDSLFEYLLIDVQMGPQLVTSRIKQAISTVHLYVQRCLLGLENWVEVQTVSNKPTTVLTRIKNDIISKDRWNSLSQYTLWDASRKIFIYPENWLDPALRDNKTDIFKQFEASLQQGNLDKDTVTEAIRSYVYAANELAQLEYQTYVWEHVDGNINKYHFFARTKNEPYQYYYRMFKSNWQGEDKELGRRWDSWKKIDVDIPSQDTDFDGSTIPGAGAFLVPAILKGRLYLFLPQIVLKTNSKASTNPVSMKKMWENPPNETQQTPSWEIKMAWTELRNEKWTAKQVSQATLKVDYWKHPDGPIFLNRLSSFRFWVKTGSSKKPGIESDNPVNDDTLLIDVEGWWFHSKVIESADVSKEEAFTPSDFKEGRYFDYGWPPTVLSRRWPVGRFCIIGSEVRVQPNKRNALGDIFTPSYFSKLEASPKIEKLFPGHPNGFWTYNASDSNPLRFAKPQDGEIKNHQLKWIMSLNTTFCADPTALILENRSDSGCKTFFSCQTSKEVETETNTFAMDVTHPYAYEIMERSTHADDISPLYRFLSEVKYAKDTADPLLAFGSIASFQKPSKGFTEQCQPHSLYTWELAFHAVMLLMEKLLATQQFELALEYARLVFDPRVEGGDTRKVWKFMPFWDPEVASVGSIKESLGTNATDTEALTLWRNNPFSPFAVAQGRPIAYMKRLVMKYVEILIAAGDDFFRRNTLDSVPLAIQRYVEASQLFGPRPRSTPPLSAKAVKTFAQLSKSLNSFNNAGVDMELEFPYMCDPRFRGTKGNTTAVTKGPKPNPFIGIAKTTYFCVPANPKIAALRDLIDDRLFKIRNSQDINGNVRTLALWEPPLDPGMLAQAAAAGISPCLLLTDMDSPMPNYRFLYLLQKAFEICAELKSVGEAFLAAKEKRDAEAFSLLRAKQDIIAQTILIDVKTLQKTEIEKSMAVLEETRKSHVMRLTHYLQLTGESLKKVPDANANFEDVLQEIEKPTMDELRMSSNEKTEMNKADSAAILTEKASIMNAVASGLMALPNLTTAMSPMGVGVQMKIDAENIAKFMTGMATVLQLKAEMDTHDSQRAARKAQMIRQLQERRLQANLAGHEIKAIDKELEVSKVRLASCNKDIEVQKKQAEQATEVQQFYQSKYTNEKLYMWMENSIRTAYYDTYLAAMQVARKAEKSFFFENPAHRNKPSYLSQTGFWDSGRDGLLSAHNLYLSLKRLEATYHERRSHDFEITKNVSLRQISPLALLSLRETGKAEFSIPEIAFDMDFPGHYMRRIKTVSISMPCIVGPYTGTNCVVTLVEHRTRVSGRKGEQYEDQGRKDDRFRTDRVPMSSIAMSSGQGDTGLFELNVNDERYLPFEGAGAMSRWKVEFPSELRQFDYNTISDVIMHVRYTSISGGNALQKAANDSVKSYLKTVSELDVEKGGFTAVFDLKNDFPNEWNQFSTAGEAFQLSSVRDRLPFWTRGATLSAKALYIVISSTPAAEGAQPTAVKWEEENKVVFEAPQGAKLKKNDVFAAAKGTSITEVDPIKPVTKIDSKWSVKFKVTKPQDRAAIGSFYAILRYGIEFKG